MRQLLAAFAGTVRRMVGWLRRRRGYVCGVDIGMDGAETTVWAKVRGDGTIEVIEIIETKPANAGAHRT